VVMMVAMSMAVTVVVRRVMQRHDSAIVTCTRPGFAQARITTR
jgi:hypothetical protein